MRGKLVIIGLGVIVVLLLALSIVSYKNLGKTSKPEEPKNYYQYSDKVPAENEIKVATQVAGDTVTVSSVSLKNGGFIAVHDHKERKPGVVLGVSPYLEPGVYSNLKISLTKASLTEKDEAVAILHVDSGDKVFSDTEDKVAEKSNGVYVLNVFITN